MKTLEIRPGMAKVEEVVNRAIGQLATAKGMASYAGGMTKEERAGIVAAIAHVLRAAQAIDLAQKEGE